ncbi:hypothetical protein Tco_0942402 [Tanacetum coccineum]
MDLESTQNNSLAKLPLLKQGEYDTWRLRIESYIQLQDYTLWEIIEEGHCSTNDVNTANVHVSTASTNNSIACLSDATVYAYLATQPNGSQVVHKDLDQIHEDDLDEMDLKWQLTLRFTKYESKKVLSENCWDILLKSAEIIGVKRTGTEVKIGQEEQWMWKNLLPKLC